MASKTWRTKTAAMRRRRARGRESGAGDVRMAGSSACLSIPIIPFYRKPPFTANGYNSTPKTPDRRIFYIHGCIRMLYYHWLVHSEELSVVALVLGGPERMRVVLSSSSLWLFHTSVHSDRGPRAWGSGACARCVEQQQHGLCNSRLCRPHLRP